MFDGKRILITGGTGSFGREFVRTLIREYRPSSVIIYSRDELKQYEQASELEHNRVLRFFIGDVRDGKRLSRAMEGVDYVVHAAALKQVPAAEYNPIECIQTNIHGAESVIQAALDNSVDRVIALSTDKAAKPINLYGATKLASDKLFVAANNMAGSRVTRFSVVRYGNVVGSRGSVVPLFKRIISEGGRELPITDVRMTRFWITLAEGVEFVFRSLNRMQGGEVFVPKIPSTRVVDLAVALAPRVPHRIVGVRPGEKLHEIMVTEEDAPQTFEFADHYVIAPAIRFFNGTRSYSVNGLGERGKLVPEGFEYSSATNPELLDVAGIKALLRRAETGQAGGRARWEVAESSIMEGDGVLPVSDGVPVRDEVPERS